MFDDRLRSSASALVRGRGRVLGKRLTTLAREHAQTSAQDLISLLNTSPKADRPSIGLLLARVILEDAIARESRSLLNDFLFRFAAHLKSSVSAPGLSNPQRLALALAAEETFLILPSATRVQRQQIANIRAALGKDEPEPDEDAWLDTLGLNIGEFRECLESIASVVSSDVARSIPERSEHSGGGPAASSQYRITDSQSARPARKHFQPPLWLRIEFAGDADPLVTATANWDPSAFVGETTLDIQEAWNHFKEGDYLSARAELGGLYASLGHHWGPRSTADGLRSWHWLRLVAELSGMEAGTVVDYRRSAVSAFELAWRCLPEDESLLVRLLRAALEDFAASDLATRRAWCAYTARAVACANHEFVLFGYTNDERAELRRAWTDQFGLNAEESRSTVSVANTVSPRLKEVTQQLYVSARNDTTVARTLRDVRRKLPAFLDEAESRLFDEAVELMLDIWRFIESDGPSNHHELKEQASTLRQTMNILATSGSLLLQDYVAPHQAKLIEELNLAAKRLGDVSRPEVSVRLDSAKLPFSATPGTRYPIRLLAANTGNTGAEGVLLRLSQPQLGIDTEVPLDTLGAGSEQCVEAWAKANGETPHAAIITCDVAWSDSLMQHFSASFALAAEDQKPASWTRTDINPFNLGTISDPSRLVGRDDDLASLEALLAGGGSAYVTGHKRVGKTSLTRVLLSRTSAQRSWAGDLMSLGRALGPDQSAAELVYALTWVSHGREGVVT